MSIVLNGVCPEICFLKTRNLMNDQMITQLLKKRKYFVQQAVTEEITKEECMQLIRLELRVLEICDIEINKSANLNAMFERQNFRILSVLSNRIDHLYYSMFLLFSFESELLEEYMEFQSTHKLFITNEIHPLIVLMSKKKCDSKLYISAALFEHEHRNMQAARNYFNEGIRIHKNCKRLRLEQFLIEIQFLVDKDLESSHMVIQKYKETIDHFRDDIELHIILLEKTLQVESINHLQYIVMFDFINRYSQNYLMWHKVALLCTEGYMLDDKIPSTIKYTTNCEHRIRSCIKWYEEGLKKLLNMEKKRNLNELFTEYLVKQWISSSVNDEAIRCLVNRAMEQAFQKGHFELGGLHKPDYYVYWAEHTNQRRPEILKMAIDRNKDNVDVWVEVLKYHNEILDNYKLVKMVFDDGVRALENKSLFLWKTMELYLQNTNLFLLEQFYEEGADSPYNEINTVYRVKYLEWCTLCKDIDFSRELFSRLTTIEPENKNLYLTMINGEKLAPIIDVNIIRNLYSLTCLKFGHQENDVRLWTDWIQFEFTYGKSPDAEDTYNVALMFVKPELMSVLEHEYDLMKEAYNSRTVTIDPVVVKIPDPEE
ncbi:uncharacterized protein LOC113558694 [Rhopalosiphum maidis]|uniref:uncharacterized protein LOC113558694 n=1 Tax=Rhopalosiphum maidis TaxID=43146 RepID=UPI000EFDD0CC|nr:uncharacterized protein LOC113558694 [Rhopalosiphum maidis]